MMHVLFSGGRIVLEDRILETGAVEIDAGRIRAVHTTLPPLTPNVVRIDLEGGFLVPGFVDLHVHGGDGADFMDGTRDAFQTVCRAHLRHGTTSLLPTSICASHERILAFFEQTRRAKTEGTGGGRVLGAHFYGPYFAEKARGAHPGNSIRPPVAEEYRQYLTFADCTATATVAPELPGAEGFVRDCRERGIVCTSGHSHCTWDQIEQAIGWGVRHIDHLFCAMSDRARLRQLQMYPMRGGLLEATLYFDELTTEVIADGKHLAPELLRLAYRCKGPDRLAIVTDSSRALDMPDGEYTFGSPGDCTHFIKRDGVGLLPDGSALASSVAGLDQMMRVFLTATNAPLHEVVRMLTLTPARIAGHAHELGSLAPGKRADLVWLRPDLHVRQVWLDGALVHQATS
jgi:N-acetylglucosamine-6-phosphate deacetylase